MEEEIIRNKWVIIKKEFLGNSILADRAICDFCNKTTIVTLVLDQDNNVTSLIKEITLENVYITRNSNSEYILHSI